MVSIYNRNGTMKSSKEYNTEVWAHDLGIERIIFFLNLNKSSKLERKALLKEFRERKGITFSDYKRGIRT